MMNQESTDKVDLSVPNEFNVFIERCTKYVWKIVNENIVVEEAEKVVDAKLFEKFKGHLKSLHKDIFSSPKKEGNTISPFKKDENSRVISFLSVINFFSSTQLQKKLFCRSECHYIVKKCFTEGVQYVKEGKIHTYKVIRRALDIYTSKKRLNLKSFRAVYDNFTSHERITQGETKTILPNTYYVIIAPCPAYFKKSILKTSGAENFMELSASSAAADFQYTNLSEDRNEGTEQTREIYMVPASLQSRDDTHDNSRHSVETMAACDPEMLNSRDTRSSESDRTKRASKRVKQTSKRVKYSTPLQIKAASSFPSPNSLRDETEIEIVNDPEVLNDSASSFTRPCDSNGQSNAMNYSTAFTRQSTSLMEGTLVPPSPNTLRDEVELNNIQAMNDSRSDNHCRAVFGIRKSKSIESYALRPDSTFRVLQDNIMTGAFVIENDDMDPIAFEYYGDVQYIREIAKFKNGSTMETILTVQKDLVNKLKDPLEKTEKIVVNYFFESAFRAIESAYKQFSEMRNTKMIGSCVPAIVPMSDSIFCGVIPDTYEAKP